MSIVQSFAWLLAERRGTGSGKYLDRIAQPLWTCGSSAPLANEQQNDTHDQGRQDNCGQEPAPTASVQRSGPRPDGRTEEKPQQKPDQRHTPSSKYPDYEDDTLADALLWVEDLGAVAAVLFALYVLLLIGSAAS